MTNIRYVLASAFITVCFSYFSFLNLPFIVLVEAALYMQTVRKYESYDLSWQALVGNRGSRKSPMQCNKGKVIMKVSSIRKRSRGSDVKSSKMVAASMTKIIPAAKSPLF